MQKWERPIREYKAWNSPTLWMYKGAGFNADDDAHLFLRLLLCWALKHRQLILIKCTDRRALLPHLITRRNHLLPSLSFLSSLYLFSSSWLLPPHTTHSPLFSILLQLISLWIPYGRDITHCTRKWRFSAIPCRFLAFSVNLLNTKRAERFWWHVHNKQQSITSA